jgi:hypothetical protein
VVIGEIVLERARVRLMLRNRETKTVLRATTELKQGLVVQHAVGEIGVQAIVSRPLSKEHPPEDVMIMRLRIILTPNIFHKIKVLAITLYKSVL